jgi:hypothetical protein
LVDGLRRTEDPFWYHSRVLSVIKEFTNFSGLKNVVSALSAVNELPTLLQVPPERPQCPQINVGTKAGVWLRGLFVDETCGHYCFSKEPCAYAYPPLVLTSIVASKFFQLSIHPFFQTSIAASRFLLVLTISNLECLRIVPAVLDGAGETHGMSGANMND